MPGRNTCHPYLQVKGRGLQPINPFVPSGLFYLHCVARSIFNIRGFWLFLLLPCFIEMFVFNANSVDPDQTPSYLGLHGLSLSFLWDARLKWVKTDRAMQQTSLVSLCVDFQTFSNALKNYNLFNVWYSITQLAFYVNLHRAVIGPSATLTGRWRPDIDLRRMLTGIR